MISTMIESLFKFWFHVRIVERSFLLYAQIRFPAVRIIFNRSYWSFSLAILILTFNINMHTQYGIVRWASLMYQRDIVSSENRAIFSRSLRVNVARDNLDGDRWCFFRFRAITRTRPSVWKFSKHAPRYIPADKRKIHRKETCAPHCVRKPCYRYGSRSTEGGHPVYFSTMTPAPTDIRAGGLRPTTSEERKPPRFVCLIYLSRLFEPLGDVTAAPRTAPKRRRARERARPCSSSLRLFIFHRCLNYRKIEPSIFPAASTTPRAVRFFRALRRASSSGFLFARHERSAIALWITRGAWIKSRRLRSDFASNSRYVVGKWFKQMAKCSPRIPS